MKNMNKERREDITFCLVCTLLGAVRVSLIVLRNNQPLALKSLIPLCLVGCLVYLVSVCIIFIVSYYFGNILRKISMELGGGQAYSQVRAESYELLSKRMGVNLKQRLTNKRRRMADEGICKSTRDKLSYVDIIAEDKKLIEGYTAIVKEMAIRYGVGKD